jgi:hypothetical protein
MQFRLVCYAGFQPIAPHAPVTLACRTDSYRRRPTEGG